MEVTRRQAMAGAAALAVAASLPVVLSNVPVLYGDGEHDDTDALRAWMEGRNVRAPDGRIVDARVLPEGTYSLRGPAEIVGRDWSASGSRFIVNGAVDSDAVIVLSTEDKVFVTNCSFERRLAV